MTTEREASAEKDFTRVINDVVDALISKAPRYSYIVLTHKFSHISKVSTSCNYMIVCMD